MPTPTPPLTSQAGGERCCYLDYIRSESALPWFHFYRQVARYGLCTVAEECGACPRAHPRSSRARQVLAARERHPTAASF